MMELQIILPMLVSKYRLDLVSGFEPDLEPDLEPAITLRSANGMMMTLHEA